MRTNILWAILVVVTVLIEARWPYTLRIQGVVPQLVLVLVVYFGITEGEERAMFTGLLGGIFKDVAADAALGHYVLCLVVVGYLVGTASRRLITDNPAVKAGVVFSATVLYGLVYIALDYIQRADAANVYALLATVFPQAFYTALLTPVLFFVLSYAPMPQHRQAH